MRRFATLLLGLVLCFATSAPAFAALPPTIDGRMVGVSPIDPPTTFSGPWLPQDRIVSYYGNPLAPVMGVLGQGSTNHMLERLQDQMKAYAVLDPSHPVVGALELIAVVAHRSPGPHGAYSVRMPDSLIEKELRIASAHHLLLILDVQVGRASVQGYVRSLSPFLAHPNVELALDPEFDMKPGDVPGIEFGRMEAADINWAASYLSDLAKTHHEQQKILIVHQFIPKMLPNWQDIHTAPHVAILKDMDGFGGQHIKSVKYQYFIGKERTACLSGGLPPLKAPAFLSVRWDHVLFKKLKATQPFVCGAIKLFYTQDTPILEPQQVLALKPPPLLVIYQ